MAPTATHRGSWRLIVQAPKHRQESCPHPTNFLALVEKNLELVNPDNPTDGKYAQMEYNVPQCLVVAILGSSLNEPPRQKHWPPEMMAADCAAQPDLSPERASECVADWNGLWQAEANSWV